MSSNVHLIKPVWISEIDQWGTYKEQLRQVFRRTGDNSNSNKASCDVFIAFWWGGGATFFAETSQLQQRRTVEQHLM